MGGGRRSASSRRGQGPSVRSLLSFNRSIEVVLAHLHTLCRSSPRYFVAATPSTERHVYYTAIPTLTQLQGWEPVVHALTDTTEPGYHAASFSPGAGYWVQNYEGPGIPWQKLKETGQHGALFAASCPSVS